MNDKIKDTRNSFSMIILAFVFIVLAVGVVFYTTKDIFNPPPIVTPQQPIPTGTLCQTNAKLYFTDEALHDLGNVCYLQISQINDLDKFAAVSNQLTNLQVLNVKDITSKQVNKSIGSFPNLRELRFDGIQGQTDLPPQVGNLSGLITLKIDTTELEKLPPEIANLQNLTTLFISGNDDLEIIPYSVSKLTKLQNVTVRYNPNVKVPDSLVTQKHLQTLVINAQKVTAIPNGVYALQSLTVLDYSSNNIVTISQDIKNLTKLTYLNLNYNQLAEMPSVQNLTQLQQLQLQNNHLTKVPFGIEQLKKLQTLNLSNNSITDNATDSLQTLSSLISLDLGNNKLTKLPPGLDHLKNLQYLRLSGNTIDAQSVAILKKALSKTNIVY